MKRISVLATLVIGMALIIPSAVSGAPPQGKVDICHNTGSAANPVVQITVAEDAVPAHLAHGDEVIVIIDADGTKTAGPGGAADVEVVCGSPLTAFPTGRYIEGIDVFDTDGSNSWTPGDDLHVEDPTANPGAIRNAIHDATDPVVLDIDGSLAVGAVVSCDLETGTFCVSPLPSPISFFDTNGNGFWDKGEDIVLDPDGDGILG